MSGDNQDLGKALDYPIHGRTGDGAFKPFAIDEVSGAFVTVDYAHHEGHQGNAYLAFVSELVANTEKISMFMKTPNTAKRVHLLLAYQSSLASTFKIWFRSTAVFAASTELDAQNRDDESSNVTGMSVCSTPTSADTDTPSQTIYVGAATTIGQGSVGGVSAVRTELILKRNQAYYFELVSRADDNTLTMWADWYEHTSKE